MERSVRGRYENALWWSMDGLGVSESVERKVVAAIALQFAVSAALAVLPFFVVGAGRIAVTLVLLGLSVVAFVNTVLIARRDLVEPILALERGADAIAAGDLDASLPETDQTDELGNLVASFADMRAYLGVVADQADALSRQEFDDPALDREVPGEFGDSLDRMAESLREYTDELEATTADLERRSEDLRRLVTTFADSADRAQDGDLTATIDESVAETGLHEEVVDNYNALLGTLADTVGELAAFADEVKNLAENTGEAADEITGRIEAIQDRSERTLAEVRETSEQVSRSVETVEDAHRDFEDIADVVGDVDASVREISEATDQRAESTTDVVAMVEEVASISEQTTAESETAAAASDQQANSLSDVSEQLGSLSAKADELEALLGTFTLDDAPESTVASAPTPTGAD